MAKSLGLVFCAFLLVFVHDWAFGDSGALTSCGGSKFKFSWSPRVLKAGGKYTFQVSGVANMNFNEGTIHVIVKQPSEQQPIVDNKQQFNCDELPKELPVKIPCPVKRGQVMNATQDYTIPGSFGIVPAGDYIISADLRNNQDQQFICVKGTLTVAEP